MNPDTGVAETPAHPRALSWRQDLDWKLNQALQKIDREWAVEDRIAAMTPAQMAAALKTVALQEDGSAVRQAIGMSERNGGFNARPSRNPSSLMGRLIAGEPISRAEAKRYQW
jgi:hypothetical protein